ncbi:MAG: hypothetical protein JWM56_670 [Candidatus Peribacteria bacterium]|nr:hypothetical protein [Candidatus Peribacteria bacterium]
MITPEAPQDDLEPVGFEPDVNIPTDDTSAAVQFLLNLETIEDATNRQVLADALAVLNNPPDNVKLIQWHAANVSMIDAEYGMAGEETPLEVNIIHSRLLTLEGRYLIASIKEKIESGSFDMAEVQKLLGKALLYGRQLERGLEKDATFLKEAEELEQRIKAL